MAPRIDLNADVGESLGPWPMGQDDALIPLVTSVNIACGSHAGDPLTMRRTVRLALSSGAAIGAHPGYPDLIGFGRRDIAMTAEELEASVLAQVAALAGIARAEGGILRHVKPHGALYHRAARDPAVARPIALAVALVDPGLRLVGPSGSALEAAGHEVGLAVMTEGFVDRAYEADGSVRPGLPPGGANSDPAVAAALAVSIAVRHEVRAADGTAIAIAVDSICIHGDTPGAVSIARAVRSALEAADVRVAAPGA